MKKMMILRGLPASGKSTFARKLLKSEPGKWKRINRDDIRAMCDDSEFSSKNEEFAREVKTTLIRLAIESGFNVVLDDTHLVASTVAKMHLLAQSIGDVEVIEKCFNTDVETCKKRNESRVGVARVPDSVIDDMAKMSGLTKGRKLVDKTVSYPNVLGKIAYDEKLPDAIMCDLDGTLAIINNRSPYDASECDVKDIPNDAVIACVNAMHAQGFKIVFMSGRTDLYKEATERFIKKHLDVPYELFMRSEGDNRQDGLIKTELFNAHVRGRYNVKFVLDDRDQVVRTWRALGIPCFQVNYGNF